MIKLLGALREASKSSDNEKWRMMNLVLHRMIDILSKKGYLLRDELWNKNVSIT